ncbi:MAG: hypothetical protein ACTSQG_05255 [Promethearchaeota archaeon]
MANFINNIKNAKSNWRKIQGSPYASLMFRYKITKVTLILFCCFIAYQIYSMIINYGGRGYMSWIARGFSLVIGILIITKAWKSLEPMKRAIEPYKKRPEHINHTNVDAKVEIDDILNKFDKNGKRIEKEVK